MLEETKYCREEKLVKDKTPIQKVTEEELTMLAYYFNMIAEFAKASTIVTPKETPEKYNVN
jgi:hypothetical protein